MVSPLLSQYALGGAVGVILILVILLCIRARFLERRRPRIDPTRALDDLEQRPQIYDAYLDRKGDSELWHDIMPVSLHPVGSWSQNPSKHAPTEVNPPISTSALSTVALIIAMPSPTPNPPPPDTPRDLDNDDDEPPPLPQLELGVADVEVPRDQ
ncbi:hypothetical protein MVEN_01411400 [Mycena venus]|uniref:Uncharacterized protein n=1 Tax=Mycena venus TaxID=2733690 RepID=A0A8H7CUW8_9AGAR|nr:hypothetical protein MVEN_01411400 [Mycena venus]